MSPESGSATTSAARAEARLAFAARARRRAEQLADTANVLAARALAANRFAEEARARINGHHEHGPAPAGDAD